MTLCIAWKDSKGSIYLASDSRISIGFGSTDVGVKVMSLPLRLYESTPAGASSPTLTHRRELGIAVIGSLTTTYIAKELLQNVFAGLQYAEGVADESFASMVELGASLFRQLTHDVCRLLFSNGLGKLVMVGYCPVERCGKAFVVSIDASSYPVQATQTELFTSQAFEFFGSGRTAAISLHQQNSHALSPYQLVRGVIAAKAIESVGGAVQAGILDSEDFRVVGVRDYRQNDSLKEMSIGHFLGGQEIVDGPLQFSSKGFVVSSPFLDPFQSEIDALFSQGYSPVSSTDHW